MKYLRVARKEKGQVIMPDAFWEAEEGKLYEVIEIGGDILLLPSPLDRERSARIEKLAQRFIEEHRKTLKGLVR